MITDAVLTKMAQQAIEARAKACEAKSDHAWDVARNAQEVYCIAFRGDFTDKAQSMLADWFSVNT